MVVMVNTFFLGDISIISVSPLPGIASSATMDVPTALFSGRHGPIHAWFKLLSNAWKGTSKKELVRGKLGVGIGWR
jgi:hypothetical protein